ncbi:DUF2207 domain-containing protein [Nitrospira lenta]|uniref:DUF2207 domain-containing protein n=1 Tax=Nitrospira lenta TaxID=1436998 RepID=A0A330L6A9_9BACT|nr:DUF2207 domain-containing protein [Nitrospira lenta]SPP64702.1 conserved membrane hypothetical protein [Nitrospira lenta]
MRARYVIRLGLLLFAWLLTGEHAGARSLVIEQFHADIQVLPSGDLVVTETIRPRFTGAWNGLKRDIPVEYRTPQGFNYTLLLDLLSATDEHQAPLKIDSGRDRHYRSFKIWLPGAQDTTKTLILTYRVANGLKYFEDHDELYWNVTGDEWDVPIESATASVSLPPNATGIKALAFSGAYGAREQQADIRIEDSTIHYQMKRPLGFREGLTAVVGWDKGLVDEPGLLQRTHLFLRYNWPLALPVGVFVAMWYLWYTRGRDPRLHPLIVSYEPPDRLTPAELGTLVDNSPDLRDITATLVDLAVRGYVRIEERQEPKLLGLWSNTEYHLHRLQPPSAWDGLKAHEISILRGIFPAGPHTDDPEETVTLSALANRFYARLDGIKSSLFDQLVTRGYYVRRPDRVKQAYTIGGIVVTVVILFGSAWLSGRIGLAFQTGAAAGLLSGLIIVGFGRIMPARTLRGTRALEKVLGFEEFLSRVESDRMDRLVKTPEMFEKFLPFAMALGVEKNWTNAFDGIYMQPPTWYQGANFAEFRPRNLTGNLSQLSAAAGTAMTSAPRSSGGSGFSSSGSSGSSGGSSGGGFGGGGGSGF